MAPVALAAPSPAAGGSGLPTLADVDLYSCGFADATGASVTVLDITTISTLDPALMAAYHRGVKAGQAGAEQ